MFSSVERDISKRSKNFKQSEIELLLNLVSEVKNVLECKKTDHVSQREKDDAWRKIEEKFNQQSGVYYREWKTLKMKYENLKKSSKKAWADEKKYVCGTGGGPNLPGIITQTDIKVKEIVGDLPICGNTSIYDSDRTAGETGVFYDSENTLVVYQDDIESSNDVDLSLTNEASCSSALPNEVNFCVPLVGSESAKKAQKIQTNTQQDNATNKRCIEEDEGFGSKFSMKELKSTVSSSLKVTKNKKSPFESSVAGKKIEVLSKAKTELVDLQYKVFEQQMKQQHEEHELRKKCLLEKHEEELKLLKLKVKIAEKELQKIS